MKVDRIKWCAGKKGGLSLSEPNHDLADAYIKKAEEALESISINTIKDWKISTAYYSIYFSLYAIMMRLGVKCEIHSCTIEFAKIFLSDYLEEDEINLVADSLKARIDSQYYVDRTVPDEQYSSMVKKAPLFFVKCKNIILKLNEKRVAEIRAKFKQSV